jgi:hypothetical protein
VDHLVDIPYGTQPGRRRRRRAISSGEEIGAQGDVAAAILAATQSDIMHSVNHDLRAPEPSGCPLDGN